MTRAIAVVCVCVCWLGRGEEVALVVVAVQERWLWDGALFARRSLTASSVSIKLDNVCDCALLTVKSCINVRDCPIF